MPEKHQFIMSRRRGTTGQINPKQNANSDLLLQKKLIGEHQNFIKAR